MLQIYKYPHHLSYFKCNKKVYFKYIENSKSKKIEILQYFNKNQITSFETLCVSLIYSTNIYQAPIISSTLIDSGNTNVNKNINISSQRLHSGTLGVLNTKYTNMSLQISISTMKNYHRLPP